MRWTDRQNCWSQYSMQHCSCVMQKNPSIDQNNSTFHTLSFLRFGDSDFCILSNDIHAGVKQMSTLCIMLLPNYKCMTLWVGSLTFYFAANFQWAALCGALCPSSLKIIYDSGGILRSGDPDFQSLELKIVLPITHEAKNIFIIKCGLSTYSYSRLTRLHRTETSRLHC